MVLNVAQWYLSVRIYLSNYWEQFWFGVLCILTYNGLCFFHYFTVKPFCKPGQVKVYGVAKHEKIHVSCEVLANPKEGGFESSSNGYETNGLKFDWVFNSSSEKIDLPQDRIEVVGSRSLAEHVPKVE